jgi:hypothetical protein
MGCEPQGGPGSSSFSSGWGTARGAGPVRASAGGKLLRWEPEMSEDENEDET